MFLVFHQGAYTYICVRDTQSMQIDFIGISDVES